MTQSTQDELHANFKAFEKTLPTLLDEHAGRFALMRHGEIVELFDSARDAFLACRRLFTDGLYSIQEITPVPADLGFHSHAVPDR